MKSRLSTTSSLILSTPKLLASVPSDGIKTHQTPSDKEWKPTKPPTSLCGNVTHGEEVIPANSATRLKKKLLQLIFHNQLKLLLSQKEMDQMMSATVSVTATPVLENIRVSDADGAWVEP